MGILDMLSPAGWIGGVIKTALTGPLIGGMVDGYKAKLSAENTTDKILADVAARELTLDMRQRELDTQQNIADNGSWFTSGPRALVMWSLGIYIAKVVVWDIVLGWGSTPSIHDPLIANAFKTILVMWFGGRTLEKIASSVTNRIGKK